jgi:phage head maturation protease
MTVINEDWTEPADDLPQRLIREARLYECSVVTWPAYEATTAGVRAHALGLLQRESRSIGRRSRSASSPSRNCAATETCS